jgi:HD-like signal output (HDOD) protein
MGITVDLLNPKTLESLLLDLPPTPAVLPRLMDMLSDAETDASDVLELVNFDPGLAAAILRASRSAFYGTRGQTVDSIDAAVAELGFKEVYRLVSFYALAQTAREPLPLYGLTVDGFWRKSVTCALAMETLCGETGAPGATGYTIGLLHALGEVLLNRLAAGQSTPGRPLLAATATDPLPEQERRWAGTTQTEVAAQVMRRWRFPEAVVEPIEFQFAPHEAPNQAQMALRLRLGKWLTHLVLDDETTARAVNPEFHFAISIPGNSFARMVEELRARLAQAAGALRGTGCTVA